MSGGMVATAIVFLPATPFFLFMHGRTRWFRRAPRSSLTWTAISNSIGRRWSPRS